MYVLRKFLIIAQIFLPLSHSFSGKSLSFAPFILVNQVFPLKIVQGKVEQLCKAFLFYNYLI